MNKTNFSYVFPPTINFGKGIFPRMASLLDDKPEIERILILCGKHIQTKVDQIILPSLKTRQVVLVSDISPEPQVSEVDRCVAAMPDAQAVFAIGGGSVIDVGKTAAMLMTNPGSAADYFYQRLSFARRGVFFAAAPTTAGTGSEATPNSVLADHAQSIKQSIRHDWMFPSAAWVDPELTYNTPLPIGAASGMDALTQGIESFCSLRGSAGTQALAAEGVRILFEFLTAACRNDYPARDQVAQASLLIGMAFGQSGLGAVHGICHPIGCRLQIPHGVVCAILLTEVLRRNHRENPDILDDLARRIGVANGATLIDNTAKLRSEVGLPENFNSYGLRREYYDFIVANCRSGSMKTNPKTYTDAEIVEILEVLS